MDLIEKHSGNNIVVWGRNATVGTALEELYQYDQPLDWYAILTSSGSKLDVTSSSISDAAAGTGARTIRITGLDASYKFQSEDLTMNGQTIVQSVKTWTDVFGADVLTHGTGKSNAGDIHIVKTGTGGTYTTGVPGTLTSAICKILTGWNTSVNGHWTNPATAKGTSQYRLDCIHASAYTQAAALLVCTQDPWGTDQSLHVECVIGIGATGALNPIDMSKAGIVLPEKRAVRLRPLGAAASAVVQATMMLSRVA